MENIVETLGIDVILGLQLNYRNNGLGRHFCLQYHCCIC
jgi:hypothetical protein